MMMTTCLILWMPTPLAVAAPPAVVLATLVVVVEAALVGVLVLVEEWADFETADDPGVLVGDPPLQAVRAIRPPIRMETGARFDMALLCRGLHQNLVAGTVGVSLCALEYA
jgi:hypothetical protein